MLQLILPAQKHTYFIYLVYSHMFNHGSLEIMPACLKDLNTQEVQPCLPAV